MNYLEQLFAALPSIDKEDLTEFFNERAAVREFSGNISRERAEALAFEDTIDYFYVVNHINQTSNV